MEKYDEKTQNTLLEMVRQKEAADKRLLKLEYVMLVISMLFLFAMLAVGTVFKNMGKPMWMFFLPVGIGLAQLLVCGLFAFRIEQTAGRYECAECGHKYVPGFFRVAISMHMGRTRYMKCPECGRRSWQKKVISRD